MLIIFGFRASIVPDGRQTAIVLLLVLAGLTFVVGFFWGLSLGQTPGKAILGLRVVDKRNGSVPGLGRMLLRDTLGKWVSGLFFGIGYLWAIWDRDGQTWHDKIAGTVVLHEASTGALIVPNERRQAFWPFSMLAACALVVCAISLSSDPAKASELSNASKVSSASNFQPEQAPLQSPTSSQSDVRPATPPPETKLLSASPESEETASPAQQPQAEQQIESVLSDWAAAIGSNSATRTADYYTEYVDRYFLQRNVSREYIETDKQSFLNKGSKVQNFAIRNINFESLAEQDATVMLTKSWVVLDPTGTSAMQRSIRSRLWLQRTPAGWKISGEQDLKNPVP